MSDITTRIEKLRLSEKDLASSLFKIRTALATLEHQRRQEELRNIVSYTGGPGAVVVEQVLSPGAGFPTSRSGIRADDSSPTILNGSYGATPEVLSFEVPSSSRPKKEPEQRSSEGKGPSLITFH